MCACISVQAHIYVQKHTHMYVSVYLYELKKNKDCSGHLCYQEAFVFLL